MSKPSDLDIYRSAHLLVQQEGEGALAKAKQHLHNFEQVGDQQAVSVWERIMRAIEVLEQAAPLPNNSKH